MLQLDLLFSLDIFFFVIIIWFLLIYESWVYKAQGLNWYIYTFTWKTAESCILWYFASWHIFDFDFLTLFTFFLFFFLKKKCQWLDGLLHALSAQVHIFILFHFLRFCIFQFFLSRGFFLFIYLFIYFIFVFVFISY